jgi:hypothetical protein
VRADKVLVHGPQIPHLCSLCRMCGAFFLRTGLNGKELGVHAQPVRGEQDLERTSWSPSRPQHRLLIKA